MNGQDDIVRDGLGFSYEARVTGDGVGVVDVRDPQDEFFARVKYSPTDVEYVVEIDGGYSTRDDLEHANLLKGVEIGKSNVPDPEEQVLGYSDEEIDGWRSMTHGFKRVEDKIMEIENIDNPDIKTFISLSSSGKDIVEPAETIVNRINPPSVDEEPGDEYDESWAPYSNSAVKRTVSGDREEMVEQVFETALSLTENVLEPRRET